MSKKNSSVINEVSVVASTPKPTEKKSKKSKKTTSAEVVSTPVPPPAPQAPVEVEQPEAPKKNKKNKKVSTTTKVEQSEETTTPIPTEENGEGEGEGGGEEGAPKAKLVRVAPTKETLLSNVDELIASIDTDITIIRDKTQKKNVGIKKLKSYRKDLKTLKNIILRVVKQKVKRVKSEAHKSTSGFQKPVQISEEMATFIRVDPKQLVSRVAVTKAICDYVREFKLQNPENRRLINADEKLATLLRYDRERDGDLTFPLLQRYMKTHFPTQAA